MKFSSYSMPLNCCGVCVCESVLARHWVEMQLICPFKECTYNQGLGLYVIADSDTSVPTNVRIRIFAAIGCTGLPIGIVSGKIDVCLDILGILIQARVSFCPGENAPAALAPSQSSDSVTVYNSPSGCNGQVRG
jgi:hypothetical protein